MNGVYSRPHGSQLSTLKRNYADEREATGHLNGSQGTLPEPSITKPWTDGKDPNRNPFGSCSPRNGLGHRQVAERKSHDGEKMASLDAGHGKS